MSKERQTLTTQRDELLASINEKGRWDQERYNEVLNLEKRISALPEDVPDEVPEEEQKPPKKGR